MLPPTPCRARREAVVHRHRVSSPCWFVRWIIRVTVSCLLPALLLACSLARSLACLSAFLPACLPACVSGSEEPRERRSTVTKYLGRPVYEAILSPRKIYLSTGLSFSCSARGSRTSYAQPERTHSLKRRDGGRHRGSNSTRPPSAARTDELLSFLPEPTDRLLRVNSPPYPRDHRTVFYRVRTHGPLQIQHPPHRGFQWKKEKNQVPRTVALFTY